MVEIASTIFLRRKESTHENEVLTGLRRIPEARGLLCCVFPDELKIKTSGWDHSHRVELCHEEVLRMGLTFWKGDMRTPGDWREKVVLKLQ